MLKNLHQIYRRNYTLNLGSYHQNCARKYLTFSKGCDDARKQLITEDLLLFPLFIKENEEKNLLTEITKSFRRTKYEYEHWDGAIHGFRETEKSSWSVQSQLVIDRMRQICFEENVTMVPATHVLDLAGDGHIRPHTDSIKFVGSTIAGLSLLSDSVARFVNCQDSDVFADLLLPRYSLYIMRNSVRYDFTHEILADNESYWNGGKVPRDRRISVLLRNEP